MSHVVASSDQIHFAQKSRKGRSKKKNYNEKKGDKNRSQSLPLAFGEKNLSIKDSSSMKAQTGVADSIYFKMAEDYLDRMAMRGHYAVYEYEDKDYFPFNFTNNPLHYNLDYSCNLVKWPTNESYQSWPKVPKLPETSSLIYLEPTSYRGPQNWTEMFDEEPTPAGQITNTGSTMVDSRLYRLSRGGLVDLDIISPCSPDNLCILCK